MKKSTKGAVAAAGAAVLLLGGAGSLAYWTDQGNASGGAITTGDMALTDGTCAANWTYADGGDAGGTVGTIVPGDSVTKDCTFTVTGTGDHLTANLSAPGDVTYTTNGTPTTLQLTSSATYDVGGTTYADGDSFAITGTQTLTAHIVVTFPYGDDSTINANDTQDITATLDAITVTLTQDQSSGDNPNA